MIVKVPIYVEIDRIDPEMIPFFVEFLADVMYNDIRKKSFTKTLAKFTNNGEISPDDLKVISREEALELLRTRK